MRLPAALALTAALSAGCGAPARGPAWPAPYVAEDDEDGGESLAPRRAVASVEASEDKAAASPAAPAAAATPAPTTPDPAATPAADAEPSTPTVITAPEEVINLDDIIIEIEDE